MKWNHQGVRNRVNACVMVKIVGFFVARGFRIKIDGKRQITHKFYIVKKGLNALIFKFVQDPRHVTAAIQISFWRFSFYEKSVRSLTLIDCWRCIPSLFMVHNAIGTSHEFWKATIDNLVDLWNGLIDTVDWSIKMSTFVFTQSFHKRKTVETLLNIGQKFFRDGIFVFWQFFNKIIKLFYKLINSQEQIFAHQKVINHVTLRLKGN